VCGHAGSAPLALRLDESTRIAGADLFYCARAVGAAMPGPLQFPKDSHDEIEKLYAGSVLASFPSYARFWEALVGRKEGQVDLVPFGLKFPNRVPNSNRKALEKSYHRIVLGHYAIFCELAGAHYQLDVARTASDQASPDRRLFDFLEAFTNFYNHLGTVRYMARNICTEIGTVQRLCRPPADATQPARTRSEDVLTRFLRARKRADLSKQLRELEDNVLVVRDNQVHRFRPFVTSLGGRFALYEPVTRDPSPLPSKRARPEASDALLRMEADLSSLGKFLNGVDDLFLQELLDCFRAEGIEVNRDQR
jgi:hypothetical protein